MPLNATEATPTGALIHAVLTAEMPDGSSFRSSAKVDAILVQLGLEHVPMDLKLLMMSGVTYRLCKMQEREKRANGQART